MKILSWNINRDNRNIGGVVDFINDTQADIICLQEFSLRNEAALKKFNEYRIVTEDEILVFRNSHKETEHMYSVLLSRYPIVKYQTIPHKITYGSNEKPSSRYRNFQAHSFFVDVDAEGRSFRVFNVHFKCVAGPNHRLSQFKEILRELSPDRENIICGDFNTFGTPLLNFMLWKLFGYQKEELLLSERREFSTLFEKHGFQNPFHGYITFMPLPAQFDYILVPKETIIKHKRRFLNPRGSDHLPIMLEI